ncbi:hypothetical protein KCU71_g15270, partial [Aureobasidium melanogenum]
MAIDTILSKVGDNIHFCTCSLAFIALLLFPAVHTSRPHKQLIHLRLSLFISVFTITSFALLRIITRHISLDQILARSLFFYLLHIVLRFEMRDTASPLLPSNIKKHVAAHQDGRRQDFDRLCIAEQRAVAEQNSVNLPSAKGEIILSGSSDSIRHGAISTEPPSPCTVLSGTRNAAAHKSPLSPPLNISSGGFSPDLWTMSPEERSLMTNSANFARGRRRRRRGAIQHDVSLGLELSSLPSPTLPSLPALSHDLNSSDDDNARVSEDLSADNDNRATPRGRLQRSFTPSERDDAGVVLVPGLLLRLGRPFSGPWRGPSSPLAPALLVAAPPAGRMARLRRLFSRRRSIEP